ncbi:MAG: hypothetical protein FJ255_03200 [Phycisphaerae bacterium]|nr:hypothetical protein [Phycisphaerae bacterium]
MKIFWALIALLTAAAAAVLVLERPGGASAPPAGARIAAPAPVAAPPVASPVAPAPVVVAAAEIAVEVPTPTVPAAVEAVASVEPEAIVSVPDPATPEAKPAEAMNPINRPLIPEGEAAVPAPAPAKPAPSAMTKVVRDDGTILINDRWVIKGEGTSAKPYEVTWEYLISAGETYDPKAGQNVVPEHIAMLDGAHVRITGWIAFPLYVQSATELLAMLNQWDGCCIGVPPTPYDAIEVRLKAPAEGDDRLATFGTIEGLFGVKPYVVGGWLVGLYVMEQARIVPGRFNDGGS